MNLGCCFGVLISVIHRQLEEGPQSNCTKPLLKAYYSMYSNLLSCVQNICLKIKSELPLNETDQIIH